MDASPERLAPRVDATTPTTAEAIAILESHGDADASRLRALEDRKRELHEARRAVAKEVKKESKKRRRIMEKAKGLSNETLLQVIVSRATTKANAKARAASSSTSRLGTSNYIATARFVFPLEPLAVSELQARPQIHDILSCMLGHPAVLNCVCDYHSLRKVWATVRDRAAN